VTDGTFIRFVEAEAAPKTKRYVVQTKDGQRLGSVSWYGAWRCYAFFPDSDTLYEHVCLREIAAFLDGLMAERRAAKGAK
jgi:hypothetical protein